MLRDRLANAVNVLEELVDRADRDPRTGGNRLNLEFGWPDVQAPSTTATGYATPSAAGPPLL